MSVTMKVDWFIEGKASWQVPVTITYENFYCTKCVTDEYGFKSAFNTVTIGPYKQAIKAEVGKHKMIFKGKAFSGAATVTIKGAKISLAGATYQF
jgi:hypothetical protein